MCIRFPISKLVPAAALSLVLGLPVVVSADTITVCWDGSGDYLTIQQGIDAASDGDEVVVCDGVYTGEGNKNLDFGGKLITVRSETGPDNCIIDCEGDGRGFHFHSGETRSSVVDGFAVTNGDASDYDWGGGAVLCENLSSPTISNCAFVRNTASHGGAVYCVESDPTIIDCNITENSAVGDGGGVYCSGWYEESSPVISNCAISANSAEAGGGIYALYSSPTIVDCNITENSAVDRGGGVYSGQGSPAITNCTITENAAEAGGGVYCSSGDPTIDNCTITGNTVEGGYPRGAGVYCSSSATISNCTISENTIGGGHGGGAGVYCFFSDELTITNCVITANRAEEPWGWGAGVYCWTSDPTISNCIIAGNVAYAVGGVMCYHSSPTLINNLVTGNSSGGVSCQSGSDPVLVNCTFTLNGTAGIHCVNNSNPTVTNCIVWWDTISPHGGSEPVVSYCDVQGGWPGEGNIDADPLFVDPDGPDDDPNTWEDNDFHLAAGSPCIDAGDNEAVPEGITTDLDGNPRFIDDPDTEDTGNGEPPIVDMGSYEYQIPGDLNGDGCVDHSDLGILLSDWQCSGGDCPGDCDGDGDTDHADLGILLAYWGAGCP